jgi:hypothetical protein
VIYERVLCGSVPEPPADVPAPKPPSPGLTTRDRYVEHAQNACAAACHALIDPIGFALESFDAIGRHRSEDRGKAVDTSGVALFPVAGEKAFANTSEFIHLLATSEEVRICFARQWFRFALGRLESEDDTESLTAVQAAFAGSGFDVRELLVALVKSPAFLYRSSPVGATAP